MKIVFFGTASFAIPTLKALCNQNFDLTIVSVTDQPTGRKKVTTSPPVIEAAKQLGLKVFQPSTLKDEGFFENFKSLEPDICVVAAYGKIIPDKYLAVPRHGFINIHPSLLPKYRGPTPVQTAILNGDSKTGVTIMKVDKEVDHGPIYEQKEVEIEPNQTFEELNAKLWEEGSSMLIDVIEAIEDIVSQEQDHNKATFTKIFEREDGRIDWSKPHQEIYNQIRALNPEPGTWTTWNDKVLNIKKAKLENGQLVPTLIQLEGKKETSFSDFLHGYPNFKISDLK